MLFRQLQQIADRDPVSGRETLSCCTSLRTPRSAISATARVAVALDPLNPDLSVVTAIIVANQATSWLTVVPVPLADPPGLELQHDECLLTSSGIPDDMPDLISSSDEESDSESDTDDDEPENPLHPFPDSIPAFCTVASHDECHAVVTDPEWVLDSGATAHMTPDRSVLSGFTPSKRVHHVSMGNGSPEPCLGVGSVTLMVGRKLLKLSNVLLVPALKHNLLSGSALDNAGCSSLGKGGVCTGTTALKFRKSTGLYMQVGECDAYTPPKPLNATVPHALLASEVPDRELVSRVH